MKVTLKWIAFISVFMDSSDRRHGAEFLRPRNTPQMSSLSFQHHRATHPCKVPAELISSWVGPGHCVGNAGGAPAFWKRSIPHTMGSWANKEALILSNDLVCSGPLCITIISDVSAGHDCKINDGWPNPHNHRKKTPYC